MQNFNLEKELAERDVEKDWQFGATSQPGIVSIPMGFRELFLPQGETQFDQFGDFQDCASRSPVNHLEALFTFHYGRGMKEANKTWLKDNGYVKDNKVTFSDRYIAVLSGTTRQGNSLKAPLETIRKQGLVPKSLLPKEDWMTWDDYYDASKITPALKKLGQEFLRRFPINYEQVQQEQFKDALLSDMVGVAGYAWPAKVDGVYPKTDGAFNHAFLLYNLPAFQAYDNYEETPGDFTKNLAYDYRFFEYGYRVYVSDETTPEMDATEINVFNILQKNGLLKYFATWLAYFKQFVKGV